MRTTEIRLGLAGAAVVGAAFGMGRFTFGLTLPDLRADTGLSATGLSDPVVGLIAGATFAGFLAGIVGSPFLAARRGPRAPTTLGGVCGALGALLVTVAGSPLVLAIGAVLAGSAAGWVWAPYSDLVTVLARPESRSRLLPMISTGTSAGLVVVGLAAVVAGGDWRTVWATAALCSAAAAALNLWWVAPIPATPAAERPPVPWRALLVPSVFVFVYQAGTALAFTYAADVARRAGLAADIGALIFVIIGLFGLLALYTGALSARFGPRRVAAGSLAVLAGALVLLAVAERSPALALVAAAVFAPGYLTGAAILAVWTTHVAPVTPGRSLSVAMVVGALGAIIAPIVVGALIGTFGLPALLLATAATCAVVGVGLAARPVSAG